MRVLPSLSRSKRLTYPPVECRSHASSTSPADPKVVRDVQYRLSFKLGDTPAAGETYKRRRRRRGFNTAME
ncbi:hypothetical protein [Streptomyces zaomyceticus]|uniref:hypothetical protein n=1 Tax=Streptomyces zaomyceticus TaxID=68286 RepID=UPI0033BC37DE